MDQFDISKDGEKRSDAGYTLQVELMGFAERWKWSMRKRESDDLSISAQSNTKNQGFIYQDEEGSKWSRLGEVFRQLVLRLFMLEVPLRHMPSLERSLMCLVNTVYEQSKCRRTCCPMCWRDRLGPNHIRP